MFTKLLIPLDGSKNAAKVVPLARIMATTLMLPIELVEVIDIGAVASRLTVETARNLDSMIGEGDRVSRRAAATLCSKAPGDRSCRL